MPLKRPRGAPLDESEPPSKQARREEKFFYQFKKIGYTDDRWHSIVRELPFTEIEVVKVIRTHVGSFLNGNGGILCFGVRPNGTIYGEVITRKQEDLLRLIIDRTIRNMHPFVDPTLYRVSFTGVVSTSSSKNPINKPELVVVQIRVSPGVRCQLYEDEFHEVYTRTDSGVPYGPLVPQEIKRHLFERFDKYGTGQTPTPQPHPLPVQNPRPAQKPRPEKNPRPAPTQKPCAPSEEKPRPSSAQQSRPHTVSRPVVIVKPTLRTQEPSVTQSDIKSSSSNDKPSSSAAITTTSNKTTVSLHKPPSSTTNKTSSLSTSAVSSKENAPPIKQITSVCVPTSTYLTKLQSGTAPVTSSFSKPLPNAAPVISKSSSLSRPLLGTAPCPPLSHGSYSSIPPAPTKLSTCRWSYRPVRPLTQIQPQLAPPPPPRLAPPPPPPWLAPPPPPLAPPPPLPIEHAHSLYPPGNPLYYRPSYHPRY